MTITIIPNYPPRNQRRCSAIVTDAVKGWRDRSGDDHYCQRQGRYLLDGKPFCRLHVGEELLKIALLEPSK